MADDLDAFLQRAAQKRKQRRQAEIVVLEPTTTPPPRPAPPRAPQRPAPAPTPPPTSARTPPPPSERHGLGQDVAAHVESHGLGRDVAAHVDTHLDSRAFEQRSSHLGELAGQADDDLEAHLRNVFGSHEPPTFGESGEVLGRADDTSGLAADALGMFQSPENLCRAIVLNEILNPPKHFW